VIDTHAHLDACSEPAETLMLRARAAGVTKVVAIGSGIESCHATLAVAEKEPGVFCALGIHPHQAGESEAERIEELRHLLADERAVAVGETGLDFYRDWAPHDSQRRLFGAHLQLATDLGLPVVVHCRAAEAEVAAVLAGFAGPVVLHCFSSPELLPVALERGYYVSFAGNVTYPNADDLRAAAGRVPADRLLVETDSPYLAPQALRGRPNEPANVVHTMAVLAAARAEEPAELEERIEANARVAFGLP
jgi:TatD DNase family protein